MDDATTGVAEQLEPLVARILAANPSPFTYTGTQTYLVGTTDLAVIDPGPDLPEHLDALIAAIARRSVRAILCTHTHRDHSPAAAPLKARSGAPIVGCAPLILSDDGPRADEAFAAVTVPSFEKAARRPANFPSVMAAALTPTSPRTWTHNPG